MGDWTPDAELAVALCLEWAGVVGVDSPADLHLLGSAIYKGGEQFDPLTSDIDIVAVLAPGLDAAGRAEAVETLRPHKQRLELEMIPRLGRSVADEPGVSLVPVTPFEVRTNVHKSGARRFFDKNFFLDLSTVVEELGLPNAGVASLPDENRAALEYVQKVRNRYLGQAANGRGGLPPFAGADPMPKALLRVAAQLDRAASDGEWYDTRRGLELMFDLLRDRRSDEPYKALFNRVSVRRGGRGVGRPLAPFDQLLLAELLHDVAASVPTDALVQWEVRVALSTPTAEDVMRLLDAVRTVAPDASLVSVRFGSVVLRFQSPARRYDLLVLLNERGVLEALFGSEVLHLSRIDGFRPIHAMRKGEADVGPEGADGEHWLLEMLAAWRPAAGEERDLSTQLGDWIRDGLRSGVVPDGALTDELVLRNGERTIQLDFAVSWNVDGRRRSVGIEVVRLAASNRLPTTLERLLGLPLPVVLVVVGNARRIAKAKETADRLERLGGNVTVMPIVLDDE